MAELSVSTWEASFRTTNRNGKIPDQRPKEFPIPSIRASSDSILFHLRQLLRQSSSHSLPAEVLILPQEFVGLLIWIDIVNWQVIAIVTDPEQPFVT